MLTRINDVLARVWDTGWRHGGRYLSANALWFVAITFMALRLPPGVVAFLAFVAPLGVTLVFIARYIWWPTGPAAVAINELVNRVTKKDLAQFVVALLAFEIGWGLFVAYWPVENSPGLLVPFTGTVIAALLFAIASNGKKGVLRKLSAVFALAAIVLLLLFVPEVKTRAEEVLDGAISASTAGGQPQEAVSVLYANVPGSFTVPNRSGMQITASAPGGIEVCRGGECVPFRDWGSTLGFDPGATYELSGPVGVATICVHLQGVRTICDDL